MKSCILQFYQRLIIFLNPQGDIDSRLMGALLVGVNRAFPFARVNKKEPVIPEEHIDTMFKVVHFAPFKISLQALALLMQITNNDR